MTINLALRNVDGGENLERKHTMRGKIIFKMKNYSVKIGFKFEP